MTTPISSTLPPDLVHAFEQTLFEVHGTAPITLQVGHGAEQVSRWLDGYQAHSATVITAWNPFGQAQDASVNQAANAQLLAEIEATGLAWQPGRGVSTTDDWFEDSFCVFDATEAQIDAWLVAHRQLAVLCVHRGASARPGLAPAAPTSLRV